MIAQGGPSGPPSCLYMKDGGGRNFTVVEIGGKMSAHREQTGGYTETKTPERKPEKQRKST